MTEFKTYKEWIEYCKRAIFEITSIPKCFLEDVEKQQKGCVAKIEQFETKK